MTTDHSIRWIESLAEQERLIGTGERGQFDLCSTKDEVLLLETLNFFRALETHVRFLVRLFNSRVGSDDSQIRYLKMGEDAQGFAVERQRKRLTVTRLQGGTVQLQCARMDDDSFGSKGSLLFSSLVEAKFEAFHQIQWYFLGSPVEAEEVVRHHLTEFIRG